MLYAQLGKNIPLFELSKAEQDRVGTQLNNDLKQAQKLKSTVDFQREKLVEQAEYEKTDEGAIQKSIRITFEKWSLKGEFEKQADYEERLRNQSQYTFTQTCTEQIFSKVQSIITKSIIKELQPYNADNEYFEVEFKINGIEWKSNINVPIKNAEIFKKNWSGMKPKFSKYDWCFVNKTLCPTIIMAISGKVYHAFRMKVYQAFRVKVYRAIR